MLHLSHYRIVPNDNPHRKSLCMCGPTCEARALHAVVRSKLSLVVQVNTIGGGHRSARLEIAWFVIFCEGVIKTLFPRSQRYPGLSNLRSVGHLHSSALSCLGDSLLSVEQSVERIFVSRELCVVSSAEFGSRSCTYFAR